MIGIINKGFIENNGILLFGAGRNCKMFLNEFKGDIKILALVDNDTEKQEKSIMGINVLSLDTARTKFPDSKIVINSEVYYHEISEQLTQYGLVENEDYCSILRFQAIWYWNKKQEVVLFQTNSAITMNCTLNCRKCSMLIPYHKSPQHTLFEVLKKDFDLYFSFVDKVRCFHIIGGEPLLHPELKRVITYLHDTYSTRINRIRVTTNGTVTPDVELLSLMQKKHIYVVVSDYTDQVAYKEKLKKLLSLLEQYQIPFEVNSSIQWNDYGFPEKPHKYDKSYLKQHMAYCSTQCKGVNDGKFYYCHTVYSADKAGIFSSIDTDVLDLKKLDPNSIEDKEKFLTYYLGQMGDGYLSLCEYCGGQSYDNRDFVKAAEQLPQDRVSQCIS